MKVICVLLTGASNPSAISVSLLSRRINVHIFIGTSSDFPYAFAKIAVRSIKRRPIVWKINENGLSMNMLGSIVEFGASLALFHFSS